MNLFLYVIRRMTMGLHTDFFLLENLIFFNDNYVHIHDLGFTLVDIKKVTYKEDTFILWLT